MNASLHIEESKCSGALRKRPCGAPGEARGRGWLGVTYSDEGEDVVHVGSDVDLDEAHHHSHLLEQELQGVRGGEDAEGEGER